MRREFTRFISFLLAMVLVLGLCPQVPLAVSAEEGSGSLTGKKLSILGASISTYTGISNNTDYNSTIGSNAVYYTAGRYGVYAEDTWWMQVANDLGLELLVNNSWSGSSALHTRSGTVGAYVDRCVQLHNNDGEEPDIIGIQMGTNDYQYYKDTLGTADIDYDALITANEDGTYAYAEPVTSLEAIAIILHKISVRYPGAEVYYLGLSTRVDFADGEQALLVQFNADLKTVCDHFGAGYVDIYNSGITQENFTTYIGDGRVHPNTLGMDCYTEAFKAALLANTAYSVDTKTVSFDLTNATADYGHDKTVVTGDSFSCALTPAEGMELEVSVTMGGEDITETAYANGTVTIDAVTADVTITAKGVAHVPQNYRWEFDGTDLVAVEGGNALTKNAGTTTDGVFSTTRYALDKTVVLLHDHPWAVEWKCEGTWRNASGSGGRMFTSTDVNADYNARYIFKSANSYLIAMGEKTTSGSHNYGIALSDYGIDGSELHTYRLENRVTDEGNMVYLFVDGAEIGPMTGYYIGTTSQNTTSDWLSGKDFSFPYIGTDTHGLTNCSIEYIQVWEAGSEDGHYHYYEAVVTEPTYTAGGYTTYICSCGDSFVDNRTDALHIYRWEMGEDVFQTAAEDGITENTLTLEQGSVSDGTFSDAVYSMDTTVRLSHKEPWAIQWKSEGDGSQSSATGRGSVILTSQLEMASSDGTWFIYKQPTSGMLAICYRIGSTSKQSGILLTDYGIDPAAEHTYRLENRVAEDGSNMVYLSVDGVELGAMNNYFISASSQNTTTDILVGQDLTFRYMGASWSGKSYYLNNCSIDYIQVWEGGCDHSYESTVTAPTCTEKGYTTHTCTACGDSFVDSYVDALGHSYSGTTCTVCGSTTSPYLQQLPDDITGCSNLYNILTPTKGYYTATKYDTSNGAVLSVVIPVEPGDRIAASSFGPVSENMGSVNGIRVTYLLGDEIVTSLSAGDVYNGYTKNGYITVPEGVDAVCIPWWAPSDSNWLTLSQISKNFASHSPKTVSAQAPTCTENGYTAGEICEICNASLGSREVIPATGHDYSGNTCTVCGTVNISAILDGKYVSILGDSISTFNGYSNDATVNTTIGGNGPRYDAGTADTKPGSYCLLESVDDTWWMHFANRSGMKLLVNNSWAGSQVFGGKTSDGRVIPAAYLERCVNLHDNTVENNPNNAPINPDVIFVYLGINDYNFNRSNVGDGTVDYAALIDSDGTYVTPTTFGEAYGILLHKMRQAYPNAQIIAMTLLPENLYSVDKTAWEQHNAYIRAAAEYYNIPVVDLAEKCAITWENYSGYMIDKIHPTTAGMELISDCIEAKLTAYYTENPPHTHSYAPTVTAPTCTEQGYTTHTCVCGDSYVDSYVDATGHTYSGTACTICGAAHPEAADYSGKVISILGGSTCTFAGYIPVADGFNLEHRARYPQDNLLTDVNDTWWMQVINELDAKLGINDSWAGSTVSNFIDGNSGDLGEDAAMASLTRIQNLGANGTPDVILFYGAMNDIGKAVTLGTFDPDTAPAEADLTATKWDSLADAYVAAILRMQYYYPEAEIISMLPGPTASYYTEAERQEYCAVIAEICAHYGVECVDLSTCGLTTDDLPDGTHPDAEGMDYITDAVLDTLLADSEMEAGENVVYSVTHELTNAAAGKSYYKGVSAGKSFVETISGEDVTVTVTMGGQDITASAYADGVITIESVTGDIVITARGAFNADGHLQQLPEAFCAGTNLWSLLEPENIYYTATGWGNNSNSNYSVTIPVEPGDRIWATSFGKAGENGYSMDGVRMTWFDENGVLESLSRDVVYAEFAEYGCITVPQGAVAVNIPMVSNADTWELYILTQPHTYSGTACTLCGAAHPEAADYSGKVISILGGSTCTFAGYIPAADGFNLEHRARYPQDNLLTDVNETWWMQVITELDAKLGINDSWAGSTVSNFIDGNSGDLGEDAAMASLTRIQNLGANGTPDVILFYGAMNDIGKAVTLGTFDPDTAPAEADLTATKWDSLADAYVAAILRMQYYYPEAEIISMLPGPTASYYTEAERQEYCAVIAAICAHYGVECVDLSTCGLTTDDLPDGTHPDAEGMDYITAAVLDTLLADSEMEAGENVVYSVTHELTNAAAGKSYYKGVSAGKSFVETVSGENVTVTVTMGGQDITASAHADGVITIESVTGDIVITATGAFNADGHLQQLPEAFCAGTNLWPLLEPENIYYTATGWGNNSNSNYSVTVPVEPGDRIWATSFGKAGENGYSMDGVRMTWFDENGVLESLSRDVVYAEFAEYGCITVPQGAVAVNIPMVSNADTWELYILTQPHTYSGTACTLCGAAHPEAADYSGKVISILGDSISTFAGYIPAADGFNLEHYARYPQDNLLTDVNETWWMQVLTELDAKLGINESWRSTEVYNYIDEEVNSSYDGTKACMASLTRIQNLCSNGTPDVILFYGGTNDITQRRTVGSFDPATAPTEVDLTSAKWDTVADAYVAAIMRMQYYYPDAQIIAMLPTFTYKNTDAVIEEYNSVFAAICEHYGVTCVDLRDCGITTADLPDGTHPDAEGMDYITDAVLEILLTQDMEPGESVVYSVTQELDGAEASLGYYKGVSAGKSFVETISGENVTVTVTMNGVDITASVYADGVVSIPAVTGNLVITAEGKETSVYAGHLQQLPEDICAGTNLWTALEPENVYYTGSDWGINATGLAHSVTIPITPGDQLWATSFQGSGTNGGTGNGIRITWFDESDVLRSMSPSETYAEFSANGYLTAPEGAVAVNVVMWNGDESNEFYILTQPHTPGEAVVENEGDHGSYDLVTYCTICGGELSREHDDGYLPGDINGDGSVNNKDLTRLFQYLSGYDVEVVADALDVNGDGSVNNKDVTRLFQYLSSWDVEIH